MNTKLFTIALGIAILALTSCGNPSMQSDNGTVEYQARRELVGPKSAVLTSPILFSDNGKFSWRCNITGIPVSNGYNNSYYFNLRFLKRINNELVPIEIPSQRSHEISITYYIRDSSGNTIVKLLSKLDEWELSGKYYMQGGPGHDDIYYWPNYVENSRMQKARESGNIFFVAKKDVNYSIEVKINAPNLFGDDRIFGIQVVLDS
jgi:hypothetical protein